MHAAQIGISCLRRSSTLLLSELLAVHKELKFVSEIFMHDKVGVIEEYDSRGI